MISFVVPAYNEEKCLAATLAAIHASARELGIDYEIVVADDASTDRTAAIAREAGAVVVTVENRQISRTRNSGARASRGGQLIFVDADTLVNAPVVAAALEAMRQGAVGGGAPVKFGAAPRWLHVSTAMLMPLFRAARWAAGCFVFCTREAFEASGGFSEKYYAAEEIHFSQALKRVGRFVFVHPAVTTSARKTEGRGFWPLLWFVVKVGVRHPFGIRRREDAGFWYDGRR